MQRIMVSYFKFQWCIHVENEILQSIERIVSKWKELRFIDTKQKT